MAKVALRFAGLLLLAYGFLAAAQTAPTQSSRSLLVNVLDRNGNAVRNLAKDSFRVKVNGHPAALLDAHYNLAPRRIVVLLDMSSSMAGETEKSKKWGMAREAIEDFLTETPAEVQVALITFSSKIHDIIDFSQGRPSIIEWLKRGPSLRSDIKGTTPFYDATAAAANLLEPALPGDSIYAITDGGDNSSRVSKKAAKQRLLQSQIRLFVFLFAEPMPTEEERSGAESVMELARDTGGFVFGVSGHTSAGGAGFLAPVEYDYDKHTRERIKLYMQALNIQVNGFYTLHLDAPLQPGKAGKVSLDIVDGRGIARKDVAFTYSAALPPQPR
jgi:Mg-chelatase subunit ChlD